MKSGFDRLETEDRCNIQVISKTNVEDLVVMFDEDGNPVGTPFGGSGTGNGQFNEPRHVAVSASGNY